MDHKAYTSYMLSQYHGAIGYFGLKRWRNITNNEQGTGPNNADGKVLYLQMQMFKNHTKLYLFFLKKLGKEQL